jgi:hypothetical protein
MGYSLCSRFRGTFIGVKTAEIQMGLVAQETIHSRLMLASAESLIRCGELDLRDWKKHCIVDANPQNPPQYSWLTLVPIALFYHDNEARLEAKLKQVISVWPDSNSLESDIIMVIGWAIAHLLKDNVEASTTISHIFTGLKTFEHNSSPFSQYLTRINSLLIEYASLETAMVELTMSNDPDLTAIVLAIYCFLSTAENFPISVQRAARTQANPHLTTVLTGALSGTYHGGAGIPMMWPLSETATTDRQHQMLQQITVADRLFATWSGLYDVAHDVTHDREKNPRKSLMMAVTAPNRLRQCG